MFSPSDCVVKIFRSFSRIVSRFYFRAEIRGAEHLPETGALLVANHTAPPIMPDAHALYAHYMSHDPKDRLRAMAHEFTLKLPVIGKVGRRLGAISYRFEDGLNALKAGHPVLIYPGGAWEATRPSRERDRIDFKNRHGFVRLALAAGVPIVPIVSAGGYDVWWVLTRGERIARFLGLRRLNVEVFPIALALPFGIVMGPAVPFLPLPRKVLIQALPPIDAKQLVESTGGTEQAAREIVRRMQAALDRLALELPRSKRKQSPRL